MADLKAGTTIGGTLVWTQGNFPLYPTGNTLLFKNFKVYSENDKPQAVDNDFVSKAAGGTYSGDVSFQSIGVATNPNGSDGRGINLYGAATPGEPSYGFHFSLQSKFGSHGTGGLWATYFKHAATYPWIFKVGNTAVASVSGTGVFYGQDVVISNTVPTLGSHATRKDYVDNQINIVTNNANSRVLRAGDTMTGALTAPNFISTNNATAASHVPRLDQVVQRGVILDFGTF